jgi:metallo-beta-lactamase family protein
MARIRWHFKGGVRTVTGSCHLLEAHGRTLLLDLGLFQGHRVHADQINRQLRFQTSDLSAALVGHAHIDHVGNLPTLVQKGYGQPIYATHATRDLAALMLRDSAHIQERDSAFVNKRERRRNHELIKPLYNEADVDATLELFCTQSYRRTFSPIPGVEASFHPAGHILGAALTRLRVDTGVGSLVIGYVVDLGRAGGPILRDPSQFEDLDFLIIESTYGNRDHEEREAALARLARVINETVERRGKIIIPAFALGRTQALVQSLAQLQDDHRVARLPIYVDSPLATDVSGVFASHPEEFDRETYRSLLSGGDPLGFEHVTYIRSVEDSKRLNERDESCVIISSSGMCEAGRVLHHLRNHIEDPRHTIAIVGYQAEGTLGHRLVLKHEEVKIFGESFTRRARVELLNAFSAHADRRDLKQYIDRAGPKLRRVFLVHGEPEQQEALAVRLQGLGYTGVVRPETDDVVDLH